MKKQLMLIIVFSSTILLSSCACNSGCGSGLMNPFADITFNSGCSSGCDG